MKHLILGGARSGKSRHAESLAQQLTATTAGSHKLYIATAQALDSEMQQRIAHHQHTRSNDGWETVEEPLQLAATLMRHSNGNSIILVDCLTLWLTNLLLASEETFQRETKLLLTSLPQLPGNILFVSNEVGLGIVPMDALSRRFVDEAGRLHQQLAAACDQVTFVAAGLPLKMK